MLEIDELRSVQLVQLDILSKVDEICRKHGIKYFLVGGTLLGAVRHQGFIPWDDDVDVAMYRRDYNRFLSIAPDELGKEFFLQTWWADPNYLRYIAKVRANDTLFVEKDVESVGMHHGIYIDIFPLDHVRNPSGTSLRLRKKFYQGIRWLCRLKTASIPIRGRFRTLKRMLRCLLGLVPNSALWRMCDLALTLGSTVGAYTTSFASGYKVEKQTFPNEVYGDGVDVTFEGRTFMAPAKWDVVLRSLYGNYMELPPPEQRVSRHTVTKIDIGAYRDRYLKSTSSYSS